jgi:prophage DNA circulation protein
MLTASNANIALAQTASAAAVTAATTSLPGTPSAFVSAVGAFTEAVRACANDTADQVQLLAPLAAYSPTLLIGTSALAVDVIALQTAIGAVCRRSALISLSRACAAYQPTSSNDASTLSGNVLPLFDAEVQVAADAGDGLSYGALRDLRSAVANDLATRGATLPALTQVTTPAPMPALSLAFTLYQDATRAEDLIARSAAIHPAFLPTSFEALAS